jgi:hypothetical protein
MMTTECKGIMKAMRKRGITLVDMIFISAREFQSTTEFWKEGEYKVELVLDQEGFHSAEAPHYNPADDLGYEIFEAAIRASTEALKALSLSNPEDTGTHREGYLVRFDVDGDRITVEYARKSGRFEYK